MENELQIKKIVESLPELWQDYRRIEIKKLGSHPFREAIADLKNLLGIDRKEHNILINWLDDNYPNWRGEEKPKLCPTPGYREAA
jgi:hypothetical protein